MKQILFVSLILVHLFLFTTPFNVLQGQTGCVLKPPLQHIDFGNSNPSGERSFSLSPDYRQVTHYCPQDGSYAIVPFTSDCFDGHWITVNQDHTPNDNEGKMLLVNAAYRPGLFFVTTFTGLSPNTTYELAAWLLNVCRAAYNCDPIRPNLRFIIANTAGKELAKFSTGELPRAGATLWLQYTAAFKTPSDVNKVILKIETIADGGCGNDFALDDITLRECVAAKTIIQKKPAPPTTPVTKQKLPIAKPIVKQKTPAVKPVQKDVPVFTKLPIKDTFITNRTAPKPRPSITPASTPVLSRANPVIKQIETAPADMVIDLYDNGEIDGDTVSIYHNNVLIVSRAALSAKPITFHIKVDVMHPHHELVMVANNLGSIPPNTSLMIINAGNKRYEVFISSSEQKNAKVVIDLKE